MKFSEKTMENMTKKKDVKLVTTEKKKELFTIGTKLSHSKNVSR